ncbi:methyl-accepting chemotaxis protein [Ideonella azotifigens]|uniref:Methyl-accepting chemotaxis protein n=1 Tax=Ideonella azotifigens TaxID=513160 RepID=A0ABP3VIT9_9BURK|nr:methyl-accepting chemotaxis protein [Ideonella azotifigens]MCD2342145.1 methyl-accepting chemotaxis protein [Ideonella azotifigens]
MGMTSNMKIGTRLSLGFGVVIAIALGMAGVGFAKLSEIQRSVEQLTSDRLVKVDQLSQTKDNMNVVARGVRNIVLMSEPEGRAKEKQRIDEMRAKNAELARLLDASVHSERGHALLAAVQAALKPYEVAMDKAIALGMANDDEEATRMLLKDVRPLQQTYFKAVDELVAMQQQEMRDAVTQIQGDAASSSVLMLVLATVAAVCGGLLAFLIRRSVVTPLRQAVGVARTVASGDLSSKIEVTSRDETGELLQAMKDMNEGLVRLVSQVRDSSESIATGSAEIATGAADLSQRTEEQASNLQQTAASMEQLTGSVRNSSDSARQASELAARGVDAALRGGQAVGQMVSTMADISQASRQVADILSVIDGIAFQTNILALNAAVEAARAGEQGKGFAVVASEVRTLAQRSAEAARQIKTLIQHSVERVEAGTRQVALAGGEMDAIVAEVRRVSGLIGEISTASAEQSTGIGQIGDAVSQLDDVTQQNAALVEQSSAAAESLREQSARLAGLVRAFRLEGAAAVPMPA